MKGAPPRILMSALHCNIIIECYRIASFPEFWHMEYAQ